MHVVMYHDIGIFITTLKLLRKQCLKISKQLSFEEKKQKNPI